MTILHLAQRAEWEAALETGEYTTSTRNASLDQVGFIHASYPDQLARIAESFYADAEQALCVLVLDAEAMRASGVRVVDEDGGAGELFPHIYGPIRPAWVTEVLPAGFDQSGTFRF